MWIVAIPIVLFIIAISVGVPTILLISTLVSIAMIGYATYEFSSLFHKKGG